MKKLLDYFSGYPRKISIWFIVSVALVVLAFFSFEGSFISDMGAFIWVIGALAALYISRQKGDKRLEQNERYLFAGVGILIALSSFINYLIAPVVFWNQPYSIGEFVVLLSGLSIAYIALLGYRRMLLAAAFPAFVVFCAQIYDTYQSVIEVVASPLLGPTTSLVIFVLNLVGIQAKRSLDPIWAGKYIIEIMSRDGVLRGVEIVTDCTGVWSLSAFTASLLVVSLAFRKIFSKKNLSFIAAGYVGTYAANILRVVAVGVSIYFFGYQEITHAVHLNAGWVAFSGWMVLFWYLFFSRRLLGRDARKR